MRAYVLALYLGSSALADEARYHREPSSSTNSKPQSIEHIESIDLNQLASSSLRERVKALGLDISVNYKADWVNNLSGGLERKSLFLGNLDVILDLDLGKAAGAQGLNFIIYGLGIHGGNPSEFIGDTFVTSNIEAIDTFKLYEAYLIQALDDRTSILFGLRDLNADYASSPSSALFLNSSFGISEAFSQTGVNGPSIFPNTALALNFKYESPSGFYFQTGGFNATAGDPSRPYGSHITFHGENGYLLVCETGKIKKQEERLQKLAIGSWSYTKEVESIDPAQNSRSNYGFYGLIDHPITKYLSVFLKHTTTTPRNSNIHHATEIGLQWDGPIATRRQDSVAIGVAQARASSDYQIKNDSDAEEVALEVIYKVDLGNGLEILPDFQYIVNPGLNKQIEDAQVATLRIKFSY